MKLVEDGIGKVRGEREREKKKKKREGKERRGSPCNLLVVEGKELALRTCQAEHNQSLDSLVRGT